MTTTEIGRYGENLGEKFLKKNGYKIIDRNNHQSHNEIDLIAINKDVIAFVEVKTRSVSEDLYSDYGTPATAVNYAKQKRLIAAAKSYLAENRKYSQKQPRMDVIEVYLNKENGELLKINHFIDAFGE